MSAHTKNLYEDSNEFMTELANRGKMMVDDTHRRDEFAVDGVQASGGSSTKNNDRFSGKGIKKEVKLLLFQRLIKNKTEMHQSA